MAGLAPVCLLADLPDIPFQAVCESIAHQDFISMCLTSKSVSECTTEHLTYLTMVLSNSSTPVQLQQWSQATQRLQHVTSIHVHVADRVSAELFEMAVLLLSQRRPYITELHLLAVDGTLSTKLTHNQTIARIPSIRGLACLLLELKTLVVKGIEVNDLPEDLQHLATAATAGVWQLQKLTLRAFWNLDEEADPLHWSSVASCVLQLAQAFPHLEELELQVPGLELDPKQSLLSSSKDGAIDCLFDETVTAAMEAAEDAVALLTDETEGKYQLAGVALLAVITTAALQLQDLEALRLHEVPNIWKPHPDLAVTSGLLQQLSAVTLSAFAADDDVDVEDSPICAIENTTMEDYGCWLLQHHSSLMQLGINTAYSSPDRVEAKWSMTWNRKQLPLQPQLLQQQTPNLACALDSSGGRTDVGSCEQAQVSAATVEQVTVSMMCHNWSISGTEALFGAFRRDLSHYSSRPAYSVLSNISSLQLKVGYWGSFQLKDMLKDMKNLRHLEVLHWMDRHHDAAVLVEAAAALPSLQSLAVDSVASSAYKSAHNPALDKLLQPLTAAAGGPGSNIRKLELTIDLTKATRTGCRWHHHLCQLDALQELTIRSSATWSPRRTFGSARGLLQLPTNHMPASLRILRCSGLYIHTATAENSDQSQTQVAVVRLQLWELHLEQCHLTSPDIFASQQLHQLSVVDCSFSGGWAAAAAAWPNMRQLIWGYETSFDSSTGQCASLVAGRSKAIKAVRAKLEAAVRTSIKQAMTEVITGFPHLKSPTVHNLPRLCVPDLHQVVQYMTWVQHVNLEFSYKAVGKSVRTKWPELSEGLHLITGDYCRAMLLEASQDLAPAIFADSMEEEGGNTSNNSLYLEVAALHSALVQRLPWAGVGVAIHFDRMQRMCALSGCFTSGRLDLRRRSVAHGNATNESCTLRDPSKVQTRYCITMVRICDAFSAPFCTDFAQTRSMSTS